jgi:excisionase family DNA binding protein
VSVDSAHCITVTHPGVFLSGQLCALLDRLALDRLRRELRGQSSVLDAALSAVHEAALSWRISAAPGSELDMAAATTALSAAVGTDEAAKLLGLGPRRIRQMAQAGHLAATRVGHTWLIDRDLLLAEAQRQRTERSHA